MIARSGEQAGAASAQKSQLLPGSKSSAMRMKHQTLLGHDQLCPMWTLDVGFAASHIQQASQAH
jgi:hypothetical protein